MTATSANAPVNLFGLDRTELRARFAEAGEKPFRADQIMHWIYRRGQGDFEGMSNISKEMRGKLSERFEIRTPELVTEQVSQDGTRKWVLRLDGGNAIETVYIPEEGRATLCISSQVGCAMDCSFCSTAQQGLNRNMTTAEIIAQVWFAARTLGGDFQNERVISNIVFMGMGEPLANYGAVLPAIRILLDDFGFGMSKRRVTVSTSGLVPFMDRLRDDVDTALAVSLHAPNDALRNQLVPINRKYNIEELMAACRRYVEGKDRKTHIVYEYVMLDGVNDSPALARDLAKLLGNMPAKVNLIPFNPFPGADYQRSKPETIRAFGEILRAKRIITTTRKTRGDDIDAACGQLVGRVQSKQKNRLRDIPVRFT
ncbi:23S rRNA (adenine(2503)-C(2))-methyltransferase RlmN [Solimonas fluminis]|uniref:Dual-specificity RNA methyltransferase RlmN n=1 Tax=Solimonas fluminis TaxID=2086571 RepID=A0A2S5TKV3_9GAMM|nr:23S rRNA (adenine(2503)-C(2))-methyltransferase RlmN [Solimonas fluminis]PPE75619.1 23S rRNA (adenine(2503)-C(2))-methyltransferase RlmN [Solimonas fluminis]